MFLIVSNVASSILIEPIVCVSLEMDGTSSPKKSVGNRAAKYTNT